MPEDAKGPTITRHPIARSREHSVAACPSGSSGFFMSERNTKMPKKKLTGNALVPSTTPTFYPIAETTIEPTQVFRVPKRHPAGDGP